MDYGFNGNNEDASLYSEEDLRYCDENTENSRNKHQDI